MDSIPGEPVRHENSVVSQWNKGAVFRSLDETTETHNGDLVFEWDKGRYRSFNWIDYSGIQTAKDDRGRLTICITFGPSWRVWLILDKNTEFDIDVFIEHASRRLLDRVREIPKEGSTIRIEMFSLAKKNWFEI